MSAPYALVVVAYHRSACLQRLLAGAADGSVDAPAQVVVVNVEGDPAVRRVAARAGANVIDVDNRGYAAAVNRGVSAVRGPLVVFSGDDLVVDAVALRRLVDVVARGDADLAVPQLCDLDGRPQASVRALPTPGRILLEWAVTGDRPLGSVTFVQKWRRPCVPERVDAFDAALVATRTELLRTQPLPEGYFLYWEELDWSYRLHASGRRAIVVPDAVVRHAGGRSDVRPDKQRLLARNAVRCVARTQGPAAAARAWPVVVLWQLRLLVVNTLRAVTGRGNRVPARVEGVRAAVGAWREIHSPDAESHAA